MSGIIVPSKNSSGAMPCVSMELNNNVNMTISL